MATAMMACGCSISYSMFGNREILNINFCMHHVMNEDVQVALHDLRKLLVELQETDPIIYDDNNNCNYMTNYPIA